MKTLEPLQKHQDFPAVHEAGWEGEHEITLAWQLNSLLVARLVVSNLAPDNRNASVLDHRYLSSHLLENRIAFAHAVSKWPSSLVLELHRMSLPNLIQKYQGSVSHWLLLKARARERETALELAFQYAISVQALLNSCFPEAEFTMVHSRSALTALCLPFLPSYATVLGRRNEPVNIAQPLVLKTTGFHCASTPTDVDSPVVDHTYPWVPSHDSQERLIRFLMWQTHPVWIVVRMSACDHANEDLQRLEENLVKCDDYLSGATVSRSVNHHQAELLREQTFRHLVALRSAPLQIATVIFTLRQPDPTLVALLGESITEMPGNEASKNVLEGGYRAAFVAVSAALNSLWFPGNAICTPNEAAAAFRLPLPPAQDLPGVPLKRFRSGFAHVPCELPGEAEKVLLGVNHHGGISQPVFCQLEERIRHMYVLGMTGTGKSTLLEHLILQDLRQGHGLCVVDPAGDLIEKILAKIPEHREKDVILVDPLDDHPIGFNLLEWQTIEERDRIIDDMYLTIDLIYDMRQTGGPIFENNYRNMMKLLMGDKPRTGFIPTVVEFPALYLHEAFRSRLGEDIDDPQLKDFIQELERTGGEASLNNLAPYVTSKFGRLANDTNLRRMVGQAKTSFSFSKVMDEGKVLLVNLRKGRFGPVVSGLLSSQIVNRFKNAALQRADMKEHERKPFFLYVDEFQNLPHDEFVELLSEARKYKLGLILANQFTGQLNKNRANQVNVFRAVLGNVGIFVIFRVGIEDAQVLGPLFHPTFSEHDLKELPNWHAYVQLRRDGRMLPPFNIQTVPDDSSPSDERAARIRAYCRKKYGKPAAKVDREIHERRRYFDY